MSEGLPIYAPLCAGIGPHGNATDYGDPVEFIGTDGDSYIATTGVDKNRSGAFPCYKHDGRYRRFQYVGPLLRIDDVSRHYWALSTPKLNPRGLYEFFYSCSSGSQCDIGHFLRRAVCDKPAGSYRSLETNYTTELPFAIDACLANGEGEPYLYFARNYTDRRRYRGTGLARVRLSRDHSQPIGKVEEVARPDSLWMCYDKRRNPQELVGTPLPGVDITNPKARLPWYTMEAPEEYSDPQTGELFVFYAAGCYKGELYATGAHKWDGKRFINLSKNRSNLVLGEKPEKNMFVPGHLSRAATEEPRFIGAARFGGRNPEKYPRLMFLSAPLERRNNGTLFLPD